MVLVYVPYALGTIVALGGLLHLHARGLDRIALAYHRTEVVVARKTRVGRYQQVAEIYRVADMPLTGRDGVDKNAPSRVWRC